jgi:hypothetical protein
MANYSELDDLMHSHFHQDYDLTLERIREIRPGIVGKHSHPEDRSSGTGWWPRR